MASQRMFYRRPENIPLPAASISRENLLPDVVNKLAVTTGIVEMGQRSMTPDYFVELSNSNSRLAPFFSRNEFSVACFAPAVIEQILVSKSHAFVKGPPVVALSYAMGWGLLAEEGAFHLQNRRSFHWGLHGQVLHQYAVSMKRDIEERIPELLRPEGFPVVPKMRSLSFASTTRTLFPRIPTADPGTFEKTSFEQMQLTMFPEKLWGFDEQGILARKQLLENREYLNQCVNQMIEAAQHNDAVRNEEEMPSLMDLLVDWNGDDEITPGSGLHAQVLTFVTASFESTGNLMSWALLLLAEHPTWWGKLREEALSNPVSDSEITTAMLDLPVLRAVMNEALRLYPPIWLITRVAQEDVTLGEHVIAQGTRIYISPYATQRLEELFPEANSFNPERWLSPENPVHKFSFIPFSRGKRSCVGESLALLSSSIVIYEMARNAISVHAEKTAEISNIDLAISADRDARVWLVPQES